MKKPTNIKISLVLGLLLVVGIVSAQLVDIERVRNGKGITSYVQKELKTWINPTTSTSYTFSLFADSLSPTKKQFVLYTKSSKPLVGFEYIFGYNKVGYTMKSGISYSEGTEFYTKLSVETVNMFKSYEFEGICVFSETESSDTPFLDYGEYFREFILAVKK